MSPTASTVKSLDAPAVMVEPSIVISSTCNAFVFIELDAIFVMVAAVSYTHLTLPTR